MWEEAITLSTFHIDRIYWHSNITENCFVGRYLFASLDVKNNGKGAHLMSPEFPPPPKYHSNSSSPFYKSCKIRLSYYYNLWSAYNHGTMITLHVQYINETARSMGIPFYREGVNLHVIGKGSNKGEWHRWEADFPLNVEQR